MRMVTLRLVLAVLALPSAASAGPLHLRWGNCAGGGGFCANQFACSDNTTIHELIASVNAPAGISLWTSFETEIQIEALGTTLPAWWQLRNQTGQTGQCRNGTLSASPAFSSLIGCTDAYRGQAQGGIGTYLVGFNGPNRARLLMVFSVPTAARIPLVAGEEYFSAHVTITSAKTVGTGACSGCSDPVTLVCTYIKVVQPSGTPGGNVEVHNPMGDPSCEAWWQQAPGPWTCLGPTPARNQTWGEIKSLYR